MSVNNYSTKAVAIFEKSGLKKIPNFAWERALLSKGDYLLQEGSNFSFLIDNDRDISWKRLLRDDNDRKRKFVKAIFDDSDFTIDNVPKSLNKIIKNSNINDWREKFIEISEIIGYLGPKKYIRWNSENTIFLLKKERLSAIHADYYSYAFYVKHLKDKIFSPFSEADYYDLNGDTESPCAFIDGWTYQDANFQILIYNFNDNNDSLEICFDKIYNSNVINILIENGFAKSDDDDIYFVTIPSRDALKKIEALCQSLQELTA